MKLSNYTLRERQNIPTFCENPKDLTWVLLLGTDIPLQEFRPFVHVHVH